MPAHRALTGFVIFVLAACGSGADPAAPDGATAEPADAAPDGGRTADAADAAGSDEALCASLREPMPIATSASNVEARLAVDGAGNALVVWQKQSFDQWDLVFRRFHAASGQWSTTSPISTAASNEQARLGVDDAGNALVVWQKQSFDEWDLMSSRYDAQNGTWSAAVPIATASSNINAQLTVDGAGNALLVWQRQSFDEWDLMSSRYDAQDGAWSAAAAIATTSSNINAQLTLDGAGNAMVVWQRQSFDEWDLMSSRYDAQDGAWSAATPIATTSSNINPQLTVDGTGNAVVVWQRQSFDEWDLMSSRYDVQDGAWSTAVPIATTSSNVSPRLAVDGAGNATVVWQRQSFDEWDLMSSRYDVQAGGWSPGAPISTVSSNENPQLAVDAAGNALAVWQRRSFDEFHLLYSVYRTDAASWSEPESVHVTSSNVSPQIALHAQTAIIVWQRRSFDDWDLYATTCVDSSAP